MSQNQTINTPQDYVNYTFNIESRGVAEVSSQLLGLSSTVSNILGQIAFKTSEFLAHTEMLAIGAGASVGAVFAKATENAIEFEQQVANVKAIGGESIDANLIGSKAMEYSNKFGMATSSMTEGLEALARAGITTTEVMANVLEEGVKLSKLEGMDLEDSINDLISTTNLLSQENVDMNAPEYSEMLKTMNQHIVSTSESAPINAQNIIHTLQHVGGYASASGIDQDDLFAVIAQLGARGTKGEMAGTALRAFIAAGQKDTAQRALQRIGLKVTDLWDDNGETMLPISEMKDVLDKAMESRGYSKQEKLEFYSDFAGYKQANQIMKINTEEVQKYKQSINEAWSLGKKLDTILGTVRGNLDRIWQTAQNFMTKVGSKILGVMSAILTPVRILLDIVTKIPFIDSVTAAGMLFVAIKSGLKIFNNLAPAMFSFMSGITKSTKETRTLRGEWKKLKDDVLEAKDIMGMIKNKDQNELAKKHYEKHGLSAKNKAIAEQVVAGQMYMDSDFYRNNGNISWDNLTSDVKDMITERYKTTDEFRINYDAYVKRTREQIEDIVSKPTIIEDFEYKDTLESINDWVREIFHLIKSDHGDNNDDPNQRERKRSSGGTGPIPQNNDDDRRRRDDNTGSTSQNNDNDDDRRRRDDNTGSTSQNNDNDDDRRRRNDDNKFSEYLKHSAEVLHEIYTKEGIKEGNYGNYEFKYRNMEGIDVLQKDINKLGLVISNSLGLFQNKNPKRLEQDDFAIQLKLYENMFRGVSGYGKKQSIDANKSEIELMLKKGKLEPHQFEWEGIRHTQIQAIAKKLGYSKTGRYANISERDFKNNKETVIKGLHNAFIKQTKDMDIHAIDNFMDDIFNETTTIWKDTWKKVPPVSQRTKQIIEKNPQIAKEFFKEAKLNSKDYGSNDVEAMYNYFNPSKGEKRDTTLYRTAAKITMKHLKKDDKIIYSQPEKDRIQYLLESWMRHKQQLQFLLDNKDEFGYDDETIISINQMIKEMDEYQKSIDLLTVKSKDGKERYILEEALSKNLQVSGKAHASMGVDNLVGKIYTTMPTAAEEALKNLKFGNGKYGPGMLGIATDVDALINPDTIKYHVDNYGSEYGNDFATALLENAIHEIAHKILQHQAREGKNALIDSKYHINDVSTQYERLGYSSGFGAEFEANYVAHNVLSQLGIESSPITKKRMAVFKEIVDNSGVENGYNLDLANQAVASILDKRYLLEDVILDSVVDTISMTPEEVTEKSFNDKLNSIISKTKFQDNVSIYADEAINDYEKAQKVIEDMIIDIYTIKIPEYKRYFELYDAISMKYLPILGKKSYVDIAFKKANERATSSKLDSFVRTKLLSDFNVNDYTENKKNLDDTGLSSALYDKYENELKNYQSIINNKAYPSLLEAYAYTGLIKNTLQARNYKDYVKGIHKAGVVRSVNRAPYDDIVMTTKEGVLHIDNLRKKMPLTQDKTILYHGGRLNTNKNKLGTLDFRSLTYDFETAQDHVEDGQYLNKIYTPPGNQLIHPAPGMMLDEYLFRGEHEATTGLGQLYYELSRNEKKKTAELLLITPQQRQELIDFTKLSSNKFFASKGISDNIFDDINTFLNTTEEKYGKNDINVKKLKNILKNFSETSNNFDIENDMQFVKGGTEESRKAIKKALETVNEKNNITKPIFDSWFYFKFKEGKEQYGTKLPLETFYNHIEKTYGKETLEDAKKWIKEASKNTDNLLTYKNTGMSTNIASIPDIINKWNDTRKQFHHYETVDLPGAGVSFLLPVHKEFANARYTFDDKGNINKSFAQKYMHKKSENDSRKYLGIVDLLDTDFVRNLNKNDQHILREAIQKGENATYTIEDLIDSDGKLGEGWAALNVTTAMDCQGRLEDGSCEFHDACYAFGQAARLPEQAIKQVAKSVLFATTSADEFANIINEQKIKVVRFNQEGDFRDVNDYLKTAEIARLSNNTKFYGYTKNKDVLEYIEKYGTPDNYQMNNSLDTWEKGNYTAAEWTEVLDYLKRGYLLCEGACENCKKCLENLNKVTVLRNKGSPISVDQLTDLNHKGHIEVFERLMTKVKSSENVSKKDVKDIIADVETQSNFLKASNQSNPHYSKGYTGSDLSPLYEVMYNEFGHIQGVAVGIRQPGPAPGFSTMQDYMKFQQEYREKGDYLFMNKWDKARYKLKKGDKDYSFIMKGIDIAEKVTKNAQNRINTAYKKSVENMQKTNIFEESGQKIENIVQPLENFTGVLESLSEIFPVLTPAVMLLNQILGVSQTIITSLSAIQAYVDVVNGVNGAADNLKDMVNGGNIAATYLSKIAGWADDENVVEGSVKQVIGTTVNTITKYLGEGLTAIGDMNITTAGMIALPILAIIAAFEGLKFWESQHAQALKEAQEALKESTAKNNVAISQYKDLNKARQNETDAIKRQQLARKESIALYELEASRLERLKNIKEESELRNDKVWGEYGLRANFQKMGWLESIFAGGIPFLGTIAKWQAGDFESQYENYEGTTANIRKIKEDTVGNFTATPEQRYVASVYDSNSMFFAQVEAYQKPLQELYDKESKLIDKYGSDDLARGSQEFREAVQEFADATGLNGETAGKMLDWLETENRVEQAKQVGRAEIGMIRVRADAEIMGIDAEQYGPGDVNNLGDAMIIAQFQEMMNEAKTEVWWELLFAYLDLFVSILVPWKWGEVIGNMKKVGIRQNELSELDAEGNNILKDMLENEADRKDYGTEHYSYYGDTPFGGALASAGAMYADEQQSQFFNNTGQVYTEDKYLAIQDQYQKDNYGITSQEITDGEAERNSEESESFKKSNSALGQLQNNGEQAHQDALDIIDAIKNPGVIFGLGAGISKISDNPLTNFLGKMSLDDIFNFMREEPNTITERIINAFKESDSTYIKDGLKGALGSEYNIAKSLYENNGPKGLYYYGKESLYNLKNTIGDKASPYNRRAAIWMDELWNGKPGPNSGIFFENGKPRVTGERVSGGLKGIYEEIKNPYGRPAYNMRKAKYAIQKNLEAFKPGSNFYNVDGIDPRIMKARMAIDDLIYGKTQGATGAVMKNGVAVPLGGERTGGLKGMYENGIDGIKGTNTFGRISDRIGLAREINSLSESGVAVSRSGIDKVVGFADSAKAAYTEDGLKGLANFGKETGKQGIKGLTEAGKAASGKLSGIKGIASTVHAETGGIKGLASTTAQGMKDAVSSKALVSGVSDVVGGVKGGGTLLKGVGKLAGPASAVIGGAITFAEEYAEHDLSKKHYNEDGTEKKALQSSGEVVGSTAGSVAGGLAGAAAGAEVGGVTGAAIGSVVPGIGTAIGGTIGALGGGVIGGFVGEQAMRQFGDSVGGTLGWVGDTIFNEHPEIAALSPISSLGQISNMIFGKDETKNKDTFDNFQKSFDKKSVFNGAKEGTDKKQQIKPTDTSKSIIHIHNLNINTEDDPEKIKTAFMNLIVELGDQVSPRQVSRTIGEPPVSNTQDTTMNNQTEGTDSMYPTDNSNNNNNNNNNNSNSST